MSAVLCCCSRTGSCYKPPPSPSNTLSQCPRQIWRIFTKYPPSAYFVNTSTDQIVTIKQCLKCSILFCVRTEPPCCFYIPVDELKLNSILQKLVLCILNHIGLSYWDGHHCGTQRRPRLSPDCASEGGRRVGQPSQTPPSKICLNKLW